MRYSENGPVNAFLLLFATIFISLIVNFITGSTKTCFFYHHFCNERCPRHTKLLFRKKSTLLFNYALCLSFVKNKNRRLFINIFTDRSMELINKNREKWRTELKWLIIVWRVKWANVINFFLFDFSLHQLCFRGRKVKQVGHLVRLANLISFGRRRQATPELCVALH